mgnify:CR=1 FL=1
MSSRWAVRAIIERMRDREDGSIKGILNPKSETRKALLKSVEDARGGVSNSGREQSLGQKADGARTESPGVVAEE